MLVDKSDEETVEEETQLEQTSAASLAWVLDTCAEAVVELTDAEDFADACISAGPAHHAQLMTGGATRVLLRANRSLVITHGRGWAEREEEFESAGESPRGVLKRILSKLSKIATPAALESLPRLVAALGGSDYLHDIVGSINRKYYKRKLRQHEAQAGKGVEPDPEEEQYWRYEIPHTIS